MSTDEGIHGWGEAYTQQDRDRSIETSVHELGNYLIGRDPWAIKHFTYVAYNDFLGKRGSMECYSAISALEHALWDIAGKALGVPAYKLLGGKVRDQVRTYNGSIRRKRTGDRPEDYAADVKWMMEGPRSSSW